MKHIMIMLGICFAMVIGYQQTTPAMESQSVQEVTVKSGDTLWDIAEANMDYEYYEDVNDYIAEIKRMNNLYSDKIYTGQNLLITYYCHNCNT